MMLSREMNPGLGRSGRTAPRLETLEDRCCPSSLTFHNHILQITGDAKTSSTMVVRDDGHGDVKVTLNGHTTTESGVQQILINSNGGDDHIDYALTGKLTTSEQLKLNLGKGNDQVKLDFSKGVSAPSLKINVDGGGGDQNVSATFGTIAGTNLQLGVKLGNGWDHVAAQFKGDLTGKANVDVNVQGGAGLDGVNVLARSNIGKSAKMSIETNVGSQNSTVHVDYAGKLDGSLAIKEKAGKAWDWLAADVDLTKGSTGSLLVHEQGGSGADLLLLNVRDAGSHLKSIDTLINTGSGHNEVLSTPGVKIV